MITERPEDIRCPVYQPRWLYALAGGFGLLIALGIAVGSVVELFWGAPILGLLNLPFGAVFAVLGIYLVRRAGTAVVLNREEVRLYRFGDSGRPVESLFVWRYRPQQVLLVPQSVYP